MQAAEVELKFHVDSLPELERRLSMLGFELVTPRTLEQNTLYDTPDRSLRERGELLRLRRYGDKHVVTHKRHPEDEDLASQYKTRIETETEIEDGAAMTEIFLRLGLLTSFRYEKYRSEFAHQGEPGHVVIDETPIGIFAELEGPTEWIDRTLARLGVGLDRCSTESYGKLFLQWKERTRSFAENLTFAEIPAAETVAI